MKANTPTLDCVRVTTTVAVDPADAFDVFTSEIDAWWRRGPRFRFGEEAARSEGTLRFVDGRLVETFESGAVFDVGRVLAWEPGRRVAFEMRLRTFDAGEKTEVDVRFEAVAGGTRVVLENRGWDAIAPAHRSRRGLEGTAFTSMVGLFWGDLLHALRMRAARRAK
jgi:hypothetical protein